MSVFRSADVVCPTCQVEMAFDVVHSVNADRRPDLRDAILEGSFQNAPCPECGNAFRLSPEFTYLDQGLQLWIAAFGAADLDRWAQAERDAQATFDEAFGAQASEAARAIGDRLQQRVTFGWPAVREKLLLRGKGLDDVSIELLKAAVMRGTQAGVPLDGDRELRVIEVRDETLVCAWQRISTEEVFQVLEVPRAVYDGIVADADAWQELRAELTPGLFIDVNRLLLAESQS